MFITDYLRALSGGLVPATGKWRAERWDSVVEAKVLPWLRADALPGDRVWLVLIPEGNWPGEMDEPFPALHKAILGVDIEGFADRRRTNLDQIAMRNGLYRCLDLAFAGSGITWDAC